MPAAHTASPPPHSQQEGFPPALPASGTEIHLDLKINSGGSDTLREPALFSLKPRGSKGVVTAGHSRSLCPMGLEMSWPQNSEVTLAVFSRIQTRKERHAESVGRNLRKLSSSLGSSTSLAHSSQCPREPDISQGQGIRTVGAKANSVGPCPQAASSKFSGGSRQQPDKHQHVSIHNCKVIERWGCRARRLYSRGVISRWGGTGEWPGGRTA